MIRWVPLLVVTASLLFLPACGEEEESEPVTVSESEPGLLAQAVIPSDSAVALARARVPGGHIESAEIEREGGLLIYTFDVTPGGDEDEENEERGEGAEGAETVIEVHVNALSGAVSSMAEAGEAGENEAAEATEEAGGEEGEEGMEAASGQVTEESPGLLERAAFSSDSALALARVRFPEARLLGGELEMEGGRLVYSLDLRVEGEEGVTEVWVDARTGEIVSVEHEAGGEAGGETGGETGGE